MIYVTLHLKSCFIQLYIVQSLNLLVFLTKKSILMSFLPVQVFKSLKISDWSQVVELKILLENVTFTRKLEYVI